MKRVRIGILSLFSIVALMGCSGNTSTSSDQLASNSSIEESSTSNSVSQTDKSSEQVLTTIKLGEEKSMATLLYQGHGSFRITTKEGKVIYVDPYAGEGYDKPADLILVTHSHSDHTKIDLIKTKNPDCMIITYKEALKDKEHQIFNLDYVTVEAVEAGNNPNHDINECVGYILTLSDKKTIYATGDTSTTDQMATFKDRNLDYALFCCDGKYNMDMDEAIACAELVNAKHSIPYHMSPGELFNKERTELFKVKGQLILADGEELNIE